jgi:NCAIR mutase (PurE)-related protein
MRYRPAQAGAAPLAVTDEERWARLAAFLRELVPVAEEAAQTAAFFGLPVTRYYDIGVAGIHRLLAVENELRKCKVLIVVAGMEGALPSVIGGLVACPVIAVPTSVGYGASFQGLSALLGMLNSCASGLTVVNIDNGFGAAYAALRIAGKP